MKNNRSVTKTIEDLPNEVILTIFKGCDSVSAERCSLVCVRWRSIYYDDVERNRTDSLVRSYGRGRIFICDRRRAILERTEPYRASSDVKFFGADLLTQDPSLPSNDPIAPLPLLPQLQPAVPVIQLEGQAAAGLDAHLLRLQQITQRERIRNAPKPRSYCADQYADRNESSWAFKFDFSTWAGKFEIVEVCLQNFFSFLDREHGRMEMGSRTPVDRLNGNNDNTHNMMTPPWSSSSQTSPSSIYNTPSNQSTSSYHRSPSNNALLDIDDGINSCDEETLSELRNLSSGRMERLAAALSHIRPLHIVFRDLSCFHQRPPLLIFWFLTLIRSSLRRLTLDSIQSMSVIKLHHSLRMGGLEELTVKQPSSHAALYVSHEILLQWLRLPSEERRPIRCKFIGCKQMTARGIHCFIKAWLNMSEPCIFESISVNEDTITAYDFIREYEHPTRDSESLEWRPPTPPFSYSPNTSVGGVQSRIIDDITARQITFKHKKLPMAIKYSCEAGFVSLHCIRMETPKSGILPFGKSTIPRTSSVQVFNSSTRVEMPKSNSLTRHLSYSSMSRLSTSPPEVVNPSIMDKFMSFIRSNA